MPVCEVGETKTIAGVKYTKKSATNGCVGCAFFHDACTNPGGDTRKAIEDGGTECDCTIWVKATKHHSAKKPTAPKPTKEPKMPEPKETKSPLYTAVRDILEAKDRETLDARTDAKVSAVLAVLDGHAGFSAGPLGTLQEAIAHEAAPAPVAPAMPWSLDGLLIDPGEEAVGQWGFFWNTGDDPSPYFSWLLSVDLSGGDNWPYKMIDSCTYSHFAYIPNFPGAALLKATTGYEAP